MAESLKAYEARIAKSRPRRTKWWREARFGMFIHWGLYAQVARNEWVMAIECIPKKDYEKLADSWRPKERPMREWAKLAKKAGMKYMVMTTKHHEGFCLWDTKQTGYNAMQRGPGRDLVQEYVDACREFGLKVGFYYSLMDWHHPDGAICAKDEKARRRFVDFTHGCVRELMTNYGKIDILWYDVSWPLENAKQWESLKMNQMARELQPHIIINNRSHMNEDYSTPEERIAASAEGTSWESCMTFNEASWGYMPSAAGQAHSAQRILSMLQNVTGGQGNLLLNIGPAPDGSVPEYVIEPLTTTGKWLAKNGEAVYGKVDRANLGGTACGGFSRKGKTAYFWCKHWPGEDFAIGGIKGKLKKASYLVSGKPVKFNQSQHRIEFTGVPKASPDKIAGVTMIKLEFASVPKYYAHPTTMGVL